MVRQSLSLPTDQEIRGGQTATISATTYAPDRSESYLGGWLGKHPHQNQAASLGSYEIISRYLLMSDPPNIRHLIRPAARVLLIDQMDRLLLIKWEALDVWITPGGGVLPGESCAQAALRELWEETGISDIELGPWVWSRRHLFHWQNQLYDAMERFFLVRTGHVTISREGLDPIEAAELGEYRWWSASAIQKASSRETFAPKKLGELLPPLIAGAIPSQPIDTDS